MITFLIYKSDSGIFKMLGELVMPASEWKTENPDAISAYVFFMQEAVSDQLFRNYDKMFVVTAQDEGIDFIRERLSNIPIPAFNTGNVVWRGEMALFIMENLSFPFLHHDKPLPHNQVFELDDSPGVWLFQTLEDEETFNDEETACKRQREWRKEHGLHPIEGTWL